MKAKKKPLKKMTVADLGLEKEIQPRLTTEKVSEPPKRQGGAKVRGTWFRRRLMTGRKRRRAYFEAQGGRPYLSSVLYNHYANIATCTNEGRSLCRNLCIVRCSPPWALHKRPKFPLLCIGLPRPMRRGPFVPLGPHFRDKSVKCRLT